MNMLLLMDTIPKNIRITFEERRHFAVWKVPKIKIKNLSKTPL
jgi:hypothetical protein